MLMWASTFGFSRVAAESFGFFTTGAILYTAAGAISIVAATAGGRLGRMLRQPRLYLLGCGALMAVYTISLYAAIGLASGRQETIEVSLMNYLWPALVLLFSVPLLGNQWRWPLIPGVLIAVGGTILATADAPGFHIAGLRQRLIAEALPLSLGVVCAITWGLYSNLSRRWGDPTGPSAMPLFMLATGLLLGGIRLLRPEQPHWNLGAAGSLAYLCIFPTTLGYNFWDISMRKGNFVLVGSASYLIPVLSVAVSCVVLNTRPGLFLWAGAALVVAGAVICRVSLKERGPFDVAQGRPERSRTGGEPVAPGAAKPKAVASGSRSSSC
jgi:drug/metabolite transporter (DMT)-like permease